MHKKLPEVPADYLQMNTHSRCHTDRVTHALQKLPMDYGANSFIVLFRPPSHQASSTAAVRLTASKTEFNMSSVQIARVTGPQYSYQYLYNGLRVISSVVYTECNRRNGPNFGRVFLMLNYTDITQNTYVQS